RFDQEEGEEVEVPDDPAYLLACREYDRELLLAMHEGLVLRADQEAVGLIGLSLSWPKRLARLKTWGGQQNLGDMIRMRIDCMLPWAGKKATKRKRKNQEDPAAVEGLSFDEPAEDAPAESLPWKTQPPIAYWSARVGVSGLIPGHARVNSIDM